MYTADGIEIVKDMKVWICPFFDDTTAPERFITGLEEHIVTETLNNCIVSTSTYTSEKGRIYSQYHRLAVFSKRSEAIAKRINILGRIKDKREVDLRAKVEEEQKEIVKIKDMRTKLLGKL